MWAEYPSGYWSFHMQLLNVSLNRLSRVQEVKHSSWQLSLCAMLCMTSSESSMSSPYKAQIKWRPLKLSLQPKSSSYRSHHLSATVLRDVIFSREWRMCYITVRNLFQFLEHLKRRLSNIYFYIISFPFYIDMKFISIGPTEGNNSTLLSVDFLHPQCYNGSQHHLDPWVLVLSLKRVLLLDEIQIGRGQ